MRARRFHCDCLFLWNGCSLDRHGRASFVRFGGTGGFHLRAAPEDHPRRGFHEAGPESSAPAADSAYAERALPSRAEEGFFCLVIILAVHPPGRSRSFRRQRGGRQSLRQGPGRVLTHQPTVAESESETEAARFSETELPPLLILLLPLRANPWQPPARSTHASERPPSLVARPIS